MNEIFATKEKMKTLKLIFKWNEFGLFGMSLRGSIY